MLKLRTIGLFSLALVSATAQAATFMDICRNTSGQVTPAQFKLVYTLSQPDYLNIPVGDSGQGCAEIARRLGTFGTVGFSGAGIPDLSALEGVSLDQMTALDVGNNPLWTLAPLARLTAPRLARVVFLNVPIRDLSPLATISTLTSVRGGPAENDFDEDENYRSVGRIESIAGLAGLTRLRSLDLLYPDLKSASGLERLTQLEHLQLHTYAMSALPRELSALSGLRDLMLEMDLSDIRGITSLTGLTQLYVGNEGERLTDLSPLGSLRALRKLSVEGVGSGVDFRFLARLPALAELTIRSRGSDMTPQQKNAIRALVPAGAKVELE